MKNRTLQKLACVGAMAAATAFSCGNFTGRAPVVEPVMGTVALRMDNGVLDFNPVGSRYGRLKSRARAFVFAGHGGSALYRVAREDLFTGAFRNIEVQADAEVEAFLDMEKRQVLITARRLGGSEQCAVSTDGMGNASIIAAGGQHGLKFYVVETGARGAPVTDGRHFKAREIEVSFSTLVTVSSAGIDGKEGPRLSRLEGMRVVHRDVLVPIER